MNFESPEWQLEAVGSLDLTSLSDLLPSAYQVKGLLTTKLSSSGNMKALEAEKYTDLPLEGTLTMDNFELVTEEFPHEFSIQTLNAEFSTERVLLKQMQGKIGSTSFQMSGTLQDFVPYALMDEKLTGTLQVAADQLIMNEWMTEDTLEDETKAPVDSIPESLQVVRIPTNIDFTMEAELGQLDYDGLLLNELQGSLQVVDGQLLIDRSGFKAADGSFNATGKYDSRPPKPIFEMDLRVNSVSIPKSFDQFVAVQKFAPVAKNMSGNLGFNFTLSGLLGEDMMPDYSSLTGSGLIQVIKAGFERSELTQGLSSTLKVAKIDNPVIDKLKMQADILDGRLFIKPFDTQFGNYNTTIGGSTGIDGTIDYTLLITVPAKGVTQQVNNLAKQYLGGK